MFDISVDKNTLEKFFLKQVENFFPDGVTLDGNCIKRILDVSLQRLEVCFCGIEKKYYSENGMVVFNHLNSDHYAMFLYVFSNVAFEMFSYKECAEKSFYLNKVMHSLDCFYSIKLPEIFLFVHPVGSVIGNASYKNYFAVYQNCTVGSTEFGRYPEFDEGVVLYSGASVLGSCAVGKNVVFGAGTLLVNSQVDDNVLFLGKPGCNRFLSNEISVINNVFGCA